MSIPLSSVVAQGICTQLGNTDPKSLAAMTAIVDGILTAVKAATVLPTALVAPTSGGPVTGVGTIT